MTHLRVVGADVDATATVDTSTILRDKNGRIVKEGDRIRALWGEATYCEHTVVIRNRGTKHERWSFDNCHNPLRGFDFEIINPY